MRYRISDSWIREQLTAYSCGDSAGILRFRAITDFPLSHQIL